MSSEGNQVEAANVSKNRRVLSPVGQIDDRVGSGRSSSCQLYQTGLTAEMWCSLTFPTAPSMEEGQEGGLVLHVSSASTTG